MDRAKVKGSGPGTPLEDATCRQRNKTLLRAPSSIKGSDAFFGRRTAAACFAPDFPTSSRIRVLCSLGNASSPGLQSVAAQQISEHRQQMSEHSRSWTADRTTQHSTARRSHGTAQHGTAQHSTAYHIGRMALAHAFVNANIRRDLHNPPGQLI